MFHTPVFRGVARPRLLDHIEMCAVLAGCPDPDLVGGGSTRSRSLVTCSWPRCWVSAKSSPVKTLLRRRTGPLTGTPTSSELHMLRPRLSAITDQLDVIALQRALAAAMLALAGESLGIFYVDDHVRCQTRHDGTPRYGGPIRILPL